MTKMKQNYNKMRRFRTSHFSYLHLNLASLSPFTLNWDMPSINSEKISESAIEKVKQCTSCRERNVYLHLSFDFLSPFTLNCDMPSMNSEKKHTHLKKRFIWLVLKSTQECIISWTKPAKRPLICFKSLDNVRHFWPTHVSVPPPQTPSRNPHILKRGNEVPLLCLLAVSFPFLNSNFPVTCPWAVLSAIHKHKSRSQMSLKQMRPMQN